MREFLLRQRENIVANLIASAIFAALMAFIIWLAQTPPIPVPSWLFVLIIATIASYYWLSIHKGKLHPIVRESFGVERVFVDGKHFIECKFKGTELVFNGRRGFSMERCSLDAPYVTFEGSAAAVLAQLVALHQDQAFRPFIENTFKKVSDNHSRAP